MLGVVGLATLKPSPAQPSVGNTPLRIAKGGAGYAPASVLPIANGGTNSTPASLRRMIHEGGTFYSYTPGYRVHWANDEPKTVVVDGTPYTLRPHEQATFKWIEGRYKRVA